MLTVVWNNEAERWLAAWRGRSDFAQAQKAGGPMKILLTVAGVVVLLVLGVVVIGCR